MIGLALSPSHPKSIAHQTSSHDQHIASELLSRRHFLVCTLSSAGAMVISLASPEDADARSVNNAPFLPPDVHTAPTEMSAWLTIDKDESIIIRLAQSEMGQGVMTALPMIVAEELGCDWRLVKVEMASANRHIRENGVYQRMGTGGSGAVRRSRLFLQQAGASARARLVAAAAQRWHIAPTGCAVADGFVTNTASGEKLSFGALVEEAAAMTLDTEPRIKTPEEFTLIGRSLPRLDTPAKTTGAAVYGIDVMVPGMVYAAISLCPVPGGKIKSYDAKDALALPGVEAVLPITGGLAGGLVKTEGLAVVADNFWRARKGVEKLTITWDTGEAGSTSSADFARDYRAALDGSLVLAKSQGDAAGVLRTLPQEAKRVAALYEVPHVAHAAMEPLNCTAHVQDGKVEIWMGTQNPEMALKLAAKTLNVPPQTVTINTCYLGGGFGRRAINDELVMAVMLSKALNKPVKVLWAREDDIRHDRFRPQAALAFEAGLGADGLPLAFVAKTAVGSIQRGLSGIAPPNGIEASAIEGLANMPYKAPHVAISCVLKNTHVPVMFWRSVGSSQNAFALESFIDELAYAAGQDPLLYRRALLKDEPDFLRVLDVLAQKAQWQPRPLHDTVGTGKGRGVSIHESFGTIVGEVVDVEVSAKTGARVTHVTAVVDCGHVINPEHVKMQIESGVIYGLSAALYGEITIRSGAVEQGNFDDYPVVRFADSPVIETHFALAGGAKWGGIGEPGTPPIAPALANAVFAATGKRIRTLPLQKALVGGAV